MLRALSTVIDELQTAMAPLLHEAFAPAGAARIRLAEAQFDLPLDLALVFAEGGPCLLAELPRSSSDGHWHVDRSRLRFVLRAELAEEVAP